MKSAKAKSFANAVVSYLYGWISGSSYFSNLFSKVSKGMVRMMKKNYLLLFFICLFLVECHVITFKNTNANTSNVKTHSKWHHLVILDLIEVSDPVNLKRNALRKLDVSANTKSFGILFLGQ